MTEPTNSIIEEARLAASARFGVRSETSLSVAVGDAERGAEAYARVLLDHLREQRQSAPGERFGHLISVVPVSAIDALREEIGDE